MSLSDRTLTRFENGIKTGAQVVDSGSIDDVTAAGAVSVDTAVSLVDSTVGVIAITLADGVLGQVKEIVMTVDGGDATLTPANLAGGTTITFGDVGDAVRLLFVNSAWHIIANNGAVVA